MTLVDGVQVAVPDDLGVISSYVLFEQRDWFEAELPFLRKLIRTGDFILDVGASFGSYTLSLAKRAGPTGRVWAFEPNPNVSLFLEHSLQANGFANTVLDRRGVSGDTATMFFTQHRYSECQGLSTSSEGASGFSVKTASLDQLTVEYQWERIDFLKIDVEGYERPVLEGAVEFFRRFSPLVLYEVQQADGTIDRELPKLFEAQGLPSYRLVPGLDLLVPTAIDESISPFVINLFGCDERRAELLQPTGMILLKHELESDATAKLRESICHAPATETDKLSAKFSFCRTLQAEWSRTSKTSNAALLQALSLYDLSRSPERSGLERWIALTEAERRMRELVEQRATPQRLSTLARILLDLGNRIDGVARINQAWQAMGTTDATEFYEPFLPCVARFDNVLPTSDWETWLRVSIVEGGERWGNFSSYYNPEDAKGRLEYLHQAGYLPEDLARRRELLSRVKISV